MSRSHIHRAAGFFAAGLFVALTVELSLLAFAGVEIFSSSAWVLTTPLFVAVPVSVGIFAVLSWFDDSPTRSVSLSRFRQALAAVCLVGAVLYAVLVGATWRMAPGATFASLYGCLGEPLWAVVSLLVLTSAALLFSMSGAATLDRLGIPSTAAGSVAGVTGLILWGASLNGLSFLVAGDSLWTLTG